VVVLACTGLGNGSGGSMGGNCCALARAMETNSTGINKRSKRNELNLIQRQCTAGREDWPLPSRLLVHFAVHAANPAEVAEKLPALAPKEAQNIFGGEGFGLHA